MRSRPPRQHFRSALYVACFLLLVAIGFVLLCMHVWRGRDASRLIWRNTVTTFVLFFGLQFLNVTGWGCRQNFGRWLRSPERYGVNVAYQLNLGHGAWPVLLEYAQHLPSSNTLSDLTLGLRELARIERPQLAARTWREQQFRRDRNATALCAWAAPLGELTPGERDAPIIQHY